MFNKLRWFFWELRRSFGALLWSFWSKRLDEQEIQKDEKTDIEIKEAYKQFEALRYGQALDNIDLASQAIEAGEALISKVLSNSSLATNWLSCLAGELYSVYSERALCYARSEPPNFAGAVEDCTRSIELKKLNAPETDICSLRDRRCSYCIELRWFERALEDANYLVEQLGDSNAYRLRARSYYGLKRLNQAKADAALAYSLAIQEGKWAQIEFDTYRMICNELAEDHDRVLDAVLSAYENGERNFERLDLSWTYLDSVDLSGIDLRGANLENCLWRSCCLKGACFYGARMNNAQIRTSSASYFTSSTSTLEGADFRHASLCGACLRGSNLKTADLRCANFERAILRYVDFSGSLMNGAIFTRANLGESILSSLCLDGLDFRYAFLEAADFSKSKLFEANLSHACLSQASFVSVDLTQANLQAANLDETNFSGAIMARADLRGASFLQASCENADLEAANLEGARLVYVNMIGANIEQTDFSVAAYLLAVEGLSKKVIKDWRRKHPNSWQLSA